MITNNHDRRWNILALLSEYLFGFFDSINGRLHPPWLCRRHMRWSLIGHCEFNENQSIVTRLLRKGLPQEPPDMDLDLAPSLHIVLRKLRPVPSLYFYGESFPCLLADYIVFTMSPTAVILIIKLNRVACSNEHPGHPDFRQRAVKLIFCLKPT